MTTSLLQQGFLRRLRAGLLVLALILPPVTLADQEPATAACVEQFHTTEHWTGWRQWASSWQVVPRNSTCNDVNVSWTQLPGRVKGQYLQRNGQWADGSAGWVWMRHGDQGWPWPVLIRGLRDGSIYRIVGRVRGIIYLVPV